MFSTSIHEEGTDVSYVSLQDCEERAKVRKIDIAEPGKVLRMDEVVEPSNVLQEVEFKETSNVLQKVLVKEPRNVLRKVEFKENVEVGGNGLKQ
jgi:hypothetical protein